jgi:hypothetical protein
MTFLAVNAGLSLPPCLALHFLCFFFPAARQGGGGSPVIVIIIIKE